MPDIDEVNQELAEPTQPVRGGSLSDLEPCADEVEEASEESFPASDPPAFQRHAPGER